MTVELMDMDVPYEVSTDVNDNGVDFIKISPTEGCDDISLSEDELDELILTLLFMKKVLKHYNK